MSAGLIRQADIYCYPTIAERGESFGIAPLEAMACGVPVVLHRLKCFSDYARDGENCIQYDVPDELVNALRLALVSRELADKISVRAADCARRFSIKQIAGLYLEQFRLEN